MRIALYFTFFTVAILTSGCLGTQYLQEDEKLLYKHRIKGAKNVDKDDLGQLYVQEPNRQLPIIPFSPYVWFFYWGLDNYDLEKYEAEREAIRTKWNARIEEAKSKNKTKKVVRFERKKRKKIAKINKTIQEGNVLMRWGEPVSVYDSAKTGQSMARILLYLNSKGYFLSKVDTSVTVSDKKAKVTYHIDEGKPYILDTLFSQTGDSAITKLVKRYKSKSHLVKGENYDQSKLSKERERLDLLLKDHGYFDFSRQYVEFNVDTAFRDNGKVAIQTTINKPSKRGYHKVFHVDEVNFTTDADLTYLTDSLREVKTYKGINYRYHTPQYNVKILSRRVFIKKDSVYSKSNTFNTQRQLANLDHFRFINIHYDSSGGKLIANIYTSPLNRYQWTNEVGINVTQGFPGPFYNVSFKKRNVFRGLEIFEINGRIGIEGVAPATEINDVYASVEAGVNGTLTFPQFVLPISSEAKARLGRVNPKTRLLAGFTYTNRPEYIRENLNFSNTYSWQNQNQALFSFTATDVSIIQSQLDSTFRATLKVLEDNGNRLINTFRPSFVSNMSFSATWNFNSYGLNFTNSAFFKAYIESGGTTLNIVGTEALEKDGLEYYKYVKLNLDYRKIHPANKNTNIAYRINAGIAKPYSDDKILPYEKYFFAGGSNGIRAWRPRRLGPGSYTPIDSTGEISVVNYDFEQQGEILLEGSLEIRKNLIGFIDYAAFVDAGNIWTIREDPSRPGSQFEFDRFYKEIAVGVGLGLRFDFSFLVLRLDAGLKVYDPSRSEKKRFILSDGFYDAPFTPEAAESVVFNIGIGYPF